MSSEKLQRNQVYPLNDFHPAMRHKPLNTIGLADKSIGAVWDGLSRRCPKKGEWYLSGADIAAYEAKNDLSAPYHIARIVRVKQTVHTTFEPL